MKIQPVAVSLLRTKCRVDRHDERLSRFSQLLCEFALKWQSGLPVSQPEFGLAISWTQHNRYSYLVRAGRFGVRSQVEKRFSHSPRSALGPTQPAVERVTSLLGGGKNVAGMFSKNPTPI